VCCKGVAVRVRGSENLVVMSVSMAAFTCDVLQVCCKCVARVWQLGFVVRKLRS